MNRMMSMFVGLAVFGGFLALAQPAPEDAAPKAACAKSTCGAGRGACTVKLEAPTKTACTRKSECSAKACSETCDKAGQKGQKRHRARRGQCSQEACKGKEACDRPECAEGKCQSRNRNRNRGAAKGSKAAE